MSIKSCRKLKSTIKKLPIRNDFNNEGTLFGMKKLTLDTLSVQSLTGNNTTGAASSRGIYWWKVDNRIIYIGKSEKPGSSISLRQSSHFNTFRNQESTREATGKKLKEFMEKCELSEMTISIFYISEDDEATICAYESRAIDEYQPILNNT